MSDTRSPDILQEHESTNLNKYTTQSRLYTWHIGVFQDELFDLLMSARPTRVLDAGCGEGYYLQYLNEHAPELDLTGIDLSGDAIAYAKQMLGDHADLHVGSLFDLPFPDDHFDLVLCSEVLEHLETPEKAVAELKRVAREHVLITVPMEPYFKFFNDLGKLLGVSQDPGHVQFWTRSSFPDFIDAHLHDVEYRTKHYYQLALGRP